MLVVRKKTSTVVRYAPKGILYAKHVIIAGVVQDARYVEHLSDNNQKCFETEPIDSSIMLIKKRLE
jgi:hypothetical protein